MFCFARGQFQLRCKILSTGLSGFKRIEIVLKPKGPHAVKLPSTLSSRACSLDASAVGRA